jgi:4-hydroxy-tetrahydrodipicolinate synthase
VTDPVFTGVGVALATLFDDDLAVDMGATVDHAARLADAGVRAVVVAGSTGEAAALDADERSQLVAKVRGSVPAGVAVLAGTGAASARQAVALSRAAADAGADAVLVLSPPLAPDPRPYYAEVVASVGVPVLAYHFPAVSQPGIPMAAMADLPAAGLKDSSGDPDRLLETLDVFPGPLYTGSSGVLSLAGPVGCTGAILALANVEPERCIRAFAGDGAAQRELAPAHLAARRAFPRALKELMHDRWGTSTNARMG